MPTTFERLSAILIKDHKLPPDRLAPEARLEDLEIDSLATLELLWSVEDAFEIKFLADPVGLLTLGDVVRHIDELMAPPAAGLLPAAPPRPDLRTP
jgi:acyl carrier protein